MGAGPRGDGGGARGRAGRRILGEGRVPGRGWGGSGTLEVPEGPVEGLGGSRKPRRGQPGPHQSTSGGGLQTPQEGLRGLGPSRGVGGVLGC